MQTYIDFSVDLAVGDDGELECCATCPIVGETSRIKAKVFATELIAQCELLADPTQLLSPDFLAITAGIGQALLPGDALDLFRSARGALPTEMGLRLRLLLRDHLLTAVPWEYAYVQNATGGRLSAPLGLDKTVSLVRHVALNAPHLQEDQARFSGRVVYASATTLPGLTPLSLDEAGEISAELETHGSADALVLDVLGEPVTTSELRSALTAPAAAVHFSGHGTDDGSALLVARPADPRPIELTAEDLAEMATHAGVNLVVISACRSAAPAGQRWAGFATALIERGIRAVVAMQHPLEDSHAVAFSAAFYSALAGGDTIEGAVMAGRIAMRDRVGLLAQWGVPVLYMRPTAQAPTAEVRSDANLRTVRRRALQTTRIALQGRHDETETIGETLHTLDDRARSLEGACQFLLLAGESGVGKTALSQFAIAEAAGRGWTIATSACEPFHEGMSFFPVRELLRKLCEGTDLVAEVQSYYGPASTPALLAQVAEDAGAEAGARREATLATFSSVVFGRFNSDSNSRPVLLVIDDLERADVGTADALACLSSRLHEGRVLLLGMYRSDLVEPVGRRHPLFPLIEIVHRSPERMRELRLGVLKRKEMPNLVSTLLDGPSALPSSFFDRLYRETEGNPLFVRELLRSLRTTDESGHAAVVRRGGTWTLSRADIDWRTPRSVEEAIGARLDVLRPEEREVLETAAVIGRQFAFEVVRRLSEANEPELVDQLETFMNYEILRELPGQVELFEFTHGKIRDVLYESMSHLRRRRLHSRVADVLKEVRDVFAEDWDALIALHLYEAGRMGEAAPLVLSTARQLARLQAGQEAAVQFARALESHAAAGLLSDELRSEIQLERIEALKLANDYEEAESAATELIRSAADKTVLAWALDHLGDIYWTSGRVSEAEQTYKAAEEHALALNNSSLLLEIASDFAEFYDREAERYVGRDLAEFERCRTEADRYLEKEYELARNGCPSDVLARALRNKAKQIRGHGDIKGALALYEEAINVCDPRIASHQVLISYAKTLRFDGRLDDARRAVERVCDWSSQAGARRSLAIASQYMGLVAMEAGDSEEETLYQLELALSLHTEIGYVRGQREVQVLLGEFDLRRGRPADALIWLRKAASPCDEYSDGEVVLLAAAGLDESDEHRRAQEIRDLWAQHGSV